MDATPSSALIALTRGSTTLESLEMSTAMTKGPLMPDPGCLSAR